MYENITKLTRIAIIVLDLKHEGVPTNELLSGLASAIDMLIEEDNLDFDETWKNVYMASKVIHELS